MVVRKSIKKFALISVYDKTNLSYLCKNLSKHNYGFISTGSTGNKIKSMGFECLDVSKLTKVREMLSNGEDLPAEFARKEVADILKSYYQSLK